MPSHFCICILPSERPLDATLLRVTAQLPSIHLGDNRSLIRQTPIKALAIKNADFDFSHIEPTGMLRRVVKNDTSQQRLCFFNTEHFLEAFAKMGIEIVHHQMDSSRRGINSLERARRKTHKVGLRTMTGTHTPPPPPLGSTRHKQLKPKGGRR